MSLDQQIVNVNEYELVASPDEFIVAINAVAARTESEGERGVVRYQFYVNAEDDTAVANIVYRNAEAWVSHHRMAYEWPEMGALQATVKLVRLTYLGPTSPEIEEMAAGVPAPILRSPTLAAGFTRTP